MPRGENSKGRIAGTTKNKLQGAIQDKPIVIGRARNPKENRQKQSRKEFMKIREGESFEDWEKRTKNQRIFGKPQPNKNVKQLKKTKVYTAPRKPHHLATGMGKKILLRFVEKPIDFLNIYAIVMRWASVRFNIHKDDFEIAYYFYNGAPFSEEMFNDLCMQLGTVRGVFVRFKKKNYITPIRVVSASQTLLKTDLYVLSIGLTRKITDIYSILSRINTIKINLSEFERKKGYKETNPQIREILEQLNIEIEETINGERRKEEIRQNTDSTY